MNHNTQSTWSPVEATCMYTYSEPKELTINTWDLSQKSEFL